MAAPINPVNPNPRIELSEETIRELCNYAALGATMAQMAAMIGVSERTLYRRVDEDEGLAGRLEKSRATANLQVSQSLFRKATKKDDLGAMIWWDKTRGGRYELANAENVREIKVVFDRSQKPGLPAREQDDKDSDE